MENKRQRINIFKHFILYKSEITDNTPFWVISYMKTLL